MPRKKTQKAKKDTRCKITISPMDIQHAVFDVCGEDLLLNKPFVCRLGSNGPSRANHIATRYEDVLAALRSTEGWYGIPTTMFRHALIAYAAPSAGFVVQLAKMSVHVVADGENADGAPLVRIIEGEPSMDVSRVVLNMDRDDPYLRPRVLFRSWSARLQLRFDAKVLTFADVANLLIRAGVLGGIGEGRVGAAAANTGYGAFDVQPQLAVQ